MVEIEQKWFVATVCLIHNKNVYSFKQDELKKLINYVDKKININDYYSKFLKHNKEVSDKRKQENNKRQKKFRKKTNKKITL